MKFKFYLRLCSHFLIATILAFVLASLFHSQFVMAELTSVGVNISFNDRLSMSLDDLISLYPTYAVVIAISLLLSFIVCSLLLKRFTPPFPNALFYCRRVWCCCGTSGYASYIRYHIYCRCSKYVRFYFTMYCWSDGWMALHYIKKD